MLRSFPENPQFRPNILGQQAPINHKIASFCVTSVILVALVLFAVITAMKGDKKDGTFLERTDKEINKGLSSLGCVGLFALVGLIIFLIAINN